MALVSSSSSAAEAFRKSLEHRDAPSGTASSRLRTPLKPHQLQGLGFMQMREQGAASSGCRGGMLLDDPGLGKTLTVLALVCGSKKDAGADDNATLVVCPAFVARVWQAEAKKHTYLAEHGGVVLLGGAAAVSRLTPEMRTCNRLIITTYDAMRMEHARCGGGAGFPVGSAYAGRFRRVVLDEAHRVKNAGSATARAVVALDAACKWVVTATPAHNHVGDMETYFRFLRCEPLCRSEAWRAVVGKDGGPEAATRLQEYLLPLAIRRTKEVLSLPAKHSSVLLLDAEPGEAEFHRTLCEYMGSRAGRIMERVRLARDGAPPATTVTSGGAMQFRLEMRKPRGADETQRARSSRMANNTILQMILRMRQACDHPALVVRSMRRLQGVPNLAAATEVLRTAGGADECPCCMDDRVVATARPCGHGMCRGCAASCSARFADEKAYCAACGSAVVTLENAAGAGRGPVTNEVHPHWRSPAPSSKMVWIMEAVRAAASRGQKGILVSQWTSFLDLLEIALEGAGIASQRAGTLVRIDGGVTHKLRGEVVRRAQEDPRVAVVLLSLAAGAEGLTLTSFTYEVICDPWWNSDKELQAEDRIHRIGQEKSVNVTHLLLRDTIEQDLRSLQVRKSRETGAILGAAGSDSKPGSSWEERVRVLMRLGRRMHRSHDDDAAANGGTRITASLLGPAPPPTAVATATTTTSTSSCCAARKRIPPSSASTVIVLDDDAEPDSKRRRHMRPADDGDSPDGVDWRMWRT